MWWLLLSLVWWCGTSAVPAPGPEDWKCPEIQIQPIVECSCDMPHTLRCTGEKSALKFIGKDGLSITYTRDTLHLDIDYATTFLALSYHLN